MTYKRDGDTVTLEMEIEDYNRLMMVFGAATGITPDPEVRRWLLRFLNDLNATNPEYTPYEIP